MSIPVVENPSITYQGDGSTKKWEYPYDAASIDFIKLKLVEADGVIKDITNNYTYEPGTKNIIYPVNGLALTSAQKLILYRETPITQNALLPNTYPFANITKALDYIFMVLQEQHGIVSQTLRFSEISTFKDIILPDGKSRSLIGWDDTGKRLKNYPFADFEAMAIRIEHDIAEVDKQNKGFLEQAKVTVNQFKQDAKKTLDEYVGKVNEIVAGTKEEFNQSIGKLTTKVNSAVDDAKQQTEQMKQLKDTYKEELNAKATTVYVDGKFEASKIYTYSKQEIDSKDSSILWQAKAYTYSQAESDNRFQPKGTYLTEHQSISHLMPRMEAQQQYQPKGTYVIPSQLSTYATIISVDSKDEEILKQAKEYTDGKALGGGSGSSVDLSKYLKKDEAYDRYQPKGDYVEQRDLYHTLDNYVSETDFVSTVRNLETIQGASTKYQPKGNYETVEGASRKYQPKGSYLTEHQSIAHLLSKSDAQNTYQPRGNYLTSHQSITHLLPRDEAGRTYATKQELSNVGPKEWTLAWSGHLTTGKREFVTIPSQWKELIAVFSYTSYNTRRVLYIIREDMDENIEYTDFGFILARDNPIEIKIRKNKVSMDTAPPRYTELIKIYWR